MGAAVPRWPPMFARPYMECRGCLRCGRSLKSAFFVWLYGCVSLCGRPVTVFSPPHLFSLRGPSECIVPVPFLFLSTMIQVKRAWCMQRGVCLKLRIAVQDTLRPAA
ncbi:hypothetical protein SORBI_3006G210266 [Sorghum bicolor]|jgi:hypothetical protein|uniref:Uncharacterized protein n=1 Tax=Sorghum bicolor TaxID=4558 RepID=A0A1Z5REV9_SORBI|nr:hypothetical protein SORBI_3006G210266 [Sorghum bicolor]